MKWISNPKTSLISIAIVGIWSVIGYNIVLFLAGQQEIPHDFYEAAQIDRAFSVKGVFASASFANYVFRNGNP